MPIEQSRPEVMMKDDLNKTVTIQQPEFRLNEHSFIPGYHHIIYATTIYVDNGHVNPQCNLQLTAARLIVNDNGATIDTSGRAGKAFNSGDRTDATSVKSGTDGGDGHDGEDGGDGGNAGAITICAGRIEGGKLTLICKGGDGGRGQDGGNGKNGETPGAAKDAQYPKKIVVGMRYLDNGVTAPKYGWGQDVRTLAQSGGNYILQAHEAQRGLRGGHGGHAGLAGKSGKGGDGASCGIVSFTDDLEIAHNGSRGAAGAAAIHGQPGRFSQGGLGGKFLYEGNVGFVSIGWSAYDGDDRWANHWTGTRHFYNIGVDSKHLTSDGKKLLLRAPTGETGKAGGYGRNGASTAPGIATAQPGQEGRLGRTRIDASVNPPSDIPFSYLVGLQRSISIALANRENDVADAALVWLIFLTRPFAQLPANPTDEQQEIHDIHHQARQALLTVGRADLKVAKGNAYRDIDAYADFVKGAIEHLERQEKNVQAFGQMVEKEKLDRTKLNDAITEAQTYQQHLLGSEASPGSIAFLRSRENALKISIATLDIDIFNLRLRLDQMPGDLQTEIDAKFHEATQITLSDLLDFTMMAVGIGLSVYTFGTSLASAVGSVQKMYKDRLSDTNLTTILRDGVWNSDFTQIKSDISNLMETDEWKNLTKSAGALAKTAIDYAGKAEAYFELLNSHKTLKTDMVDVQAAVLVFDTAKLELRRQRAQLEADLHKLLDEYDLAVEWKRVFENYFHTANTRFDNLGHLSELQADRREAEFQLNLSRRNEAALRAQLSMAEFNPASVEGDTTVQSLAAGQALAAEQGLARVMDLARAYRAWSLKDFRFPQIPHNLSASELSARFNQPLWTEIKDHLLTLPTPSALKFPTLKTPRQIFPTDPDAFRQAQFDKEQNIWRFGFTAAIDPNANIYHAQVINVRAFLKGLKVKDGSEVYCILTHLGACQFLDRSRNVVTTMQVPATITFSYRVEDGSPDFGAKTGVNAKFDKPDMPQRIRYSPYGTWELKVPADYQLVDGGQVYNQDLDWSGFEGIELYCDAEFFDFAALRKK